MQWNFLGVYVIGLVLGAYYYMLWVLSIDDVRFTWYYLYTMIYYFIYLFCLLTTIDPFDIFGLSVCILDIKMIWCDRLCGFYYCWFLYLCSGSGLMEDGSIHSWYGGHFVSCYKYLDKHIEHLDDLMVYVSRGIVPLIMFGGYLSLLIQSTQQKGIRCCTHCML